MVYTVTCNPAVDYTVELEELRVGTLHRPHTTSIHFGGKGVNVSRVLMSLGVPTVMGGFIAGDTGRMLEHGLQQQGALTDFISLPSGATRINVKIRAREETELNAGGPPFDRSAWQRLCDKVSALPAGDTLCLCGSGLPSMDNTAYATLLQSVASGVRTVVDTTGVMLKNTFSCHPFLIKPNRAELEELVGYPIHTLAETEQAARECCRQGVQNVLVSLGADGAVLCTADACFHCDAPHGEVKGTVGAGDSMVAGFLFAVGQGCSLRESLGWAVAAGSATAFADGLADADAIRTLQREMGQKI